MNPDNYEFQSEFARRYFSMGRAEGKAEGKADLVLKLATVKFGPLSAEVQQRIREATAIELDLMAERLLVASAPEEWLRTS